MKKRTQHPRDLIIERAPHKLYRHSRHRSYHGLLLDSLKPVQRRVFFTYHFIKRVIDDDATLFAILASTINRTKWGAGTKIYWDETTSTFVDMKELKRNYNTIEWRCALSGKLIRSEIDNFSLENFVHVDHRDALKAPMIDSRILKSSVDFRKHVKKLLLDDQNKFLRHIRANAKR